MRTRGTRPGHGVPAVTERLLPTGLSHTGKQDLGTEARHLVSFHCTSVPSRFPHAATPCDLRLRQPCIRPAVITVPHT